MGWNCRRPINCYNDRTRYRTLVVLHLFDIIFFTIRLALVSNDINTNATGTKQFLIPILLFDLISSVPLVFCDLLYIILRHCIVPLITRDDSFPRLWHFATMTCIRPQSYKEHPQAILLMRIIFIICSFILRFICFVVAASCSAKFKSQCTAYTVIAAFALVSSGFLIIVEFVHFFRLWSYNPTETRNNNNDNKIHSVSSETKVDITNRRHLRFIHHSLLNDQNADGFRNSRCKQGVKCQSRRLHHHLLYHSLGTERDISSEMLNENLQKSFIAFYQTNKREALEIAQNGFPYGDNSNKNYKDYLCLKSTVFFTPTCIQKSPPEDAIICVRLNLGRVEKITTEREPSLETYFGRADGNCDTVYVQNKQRFYLRMPGQIEKWIIAINANVPANDQLDGRFYKPCL